MSRRAIMIAVITGVAVLLAAGLAVAAADGVGGSSDAPGCGMVPRSGLAKEPAGCNPGGECRSRSEHCEQVENGACAGDCERLREQLRERDGECPCDGTGEQFRKGNGTPAGEEVPGAEGAVRRYGSGYVAGGSGDGDCAGDCLRERDRARDCARDGSGGA
ncbi:MAG: hypothetical protein H5T73_00305 [Actinobacteria bacterium]|nr:hypothetical protein [Actinomycetota bacterium]